MVRPTTHCCILYHGTDTMTSGLTRFLTNPNLTQDFADDDVIMVIDALDVWLQLSPDVVWRGFQASGENVMVAAEKNCWPESADSVSGGIHFTDMVTRKR